MEAPQGRYRIIERDRRLITVDTYTGLEVGSGQLHAGLLRERKISASAESAPTPLAPPSMTAAPIAPASDTVAADTGKRYIFAVAAISIILVLIFTGLWTFVAALFLLPATRGPMIGVIKYFYRQILGFSRDGD